VAGSAKAAKPATRNPATEGVPADGLTVNLGKDATFAAFTTSAVRANRVTSTPGARCSSVEARIVLDGRTGFWATVRPATSADTDDSDGTNGFGDMPAATAPPVLTTDTPKRTEQPAAT